MKQLYPFQRVAVEKLCLHKARLIGDEMGLGKTLTAIALDRQNRNLDQVPVARKTLVVAPLSVLSSWEDHLREQTGLPVRVIDPKNRQKFIDDALNVRANGYFVCHWDVLRLMPELQKVGWFHIIADEVHRAKNRKSLQTRALKKLRTVYKTGLSGTPAANKPQDLWSILHWLWPTYYSSYWKFVNHYTVTDYDPRGYHKIVGVQNQESLHEEMRPWYIRRLKEEVLPDLPPRYYTQIWVDLHPQQRRAYNQMRDEQIAWVASKKDAELEMPMVAAQVVTQLTRLQQFALGYMYFDEERQKWLLTDPSAKIDALLDIIQDNPEEPLVVFSQFKSAIMLASRKLTTNGIAHAVITGDVSKPDRAEAVKAFQAKRVPIIMGTIATAGEGITLTAASTVVFLDRAWSPSWNRQAEDRLHRIGQREAVQVIDLMARNTVDLGRHQQIKQKAEWIRQILGDPGTIQMGEARRA